MPTYAIGDIQGCFKELQLLLSHIQFNPNQDTLWFAGDLVNRGYHSLEVLRFIKALGSNHHSVLGNHDLHLIAIAYGKRKLRKEDTLEEILAAKDCHDLIEWLRHRPLLHYDANLSYVMTHAGLGPLWRLEKAMQLAKEVETVLQSDAPSALLENMYGNEPSQWRDDLSGIDRLRCIINYFTRMRFCYADGRLDLTYQGDVAHKPRDLIPWFEISNRKNKNEKIIFGHWAALNGETHVRNLYPLDTGCVWGNSLTALRLEDQHRFSVRCQARSSMTKL